MFNLFKNNKSNQYLDFIKNEFIKTDYYFHLSTQDLGQSVIFKPKLPNHNLIKPAYSQYPEYHKKRICVSKKGHSTLLTLFGKDKIINTKAPTYLYITKDKVKAYRAINTNEADQEFYLFEKTEFIKLYDLNCEEYHQILFFLWQMGQCKHTYSDTVSFFVARENIINFGKILIERKDWEAQHNKAVKHPYLNRKIDYIEWFATSEFLYQIDSHDPSNPVNFF